MEFIISCHSELFLFEPSQKMPNAILSFMFSQAQYLKSLMLDFFFTLNKSQNAL